MSLSLYPPFKSWRYLRSPLFTVQEGLEVARALCARFPKVAPALVKRAKDNLQRVADEAERALSARRRQTHLISEEDNKILDHDMPRAWTAMLMRLEAYSKLSHDRHRAAARADELVEELFFSEGPDFLKDTYAAQLAAMQRTMQRIAEGESDAELNQLCGPEFLDWLRELLPQYQRIVHDLAQRDGEPVVNLMVHRNALGRAVVTYATAICLTVNDNDRDTVNQAYAALEPLNNQLGVSAERGRSVASSADLSPSWHSAEAPLPA